MPSAKADPTCIILKITRSGLGFSQSSLARVNLIDAPKGQRYGNCFVQNHGCKKLAGVIHGRHF